MGTSTKLKEAFEAEAEFGAFYTGGVVAWKSNGEELFCQGVEGINVINIQTGQIVRKIGAKTLEGADDISEDSIYTFALSENDEYVITAHKSGLLKLWSAEECKTLKMWKSGHKGPIARVAFRSRGSIVASGGSDSAVRIWDYELKSCLCALRESQGVISVIAFHPNLDGTLVFAAGDDNKINCWDYTSKKLINTYSGHFSKVTAIAFEAAVTSLDRYMVSVSRDKVLILWNLSNGTQQKVIPLYESLEGVCILPLKGKLPNNFDLESESNEGKIFAAIAGEEGLIKIWDCENSKIVYSQTKSAISKAAEEGGLAVTQLLHCSQTNQLAVVSADHNIIVHNISTFHTAKQLIGFSDEILDLCFVGKNSRFLAVATNSNDIKLYDTSNMNCEILKGHTDIVLALSSYKNLLLSSSKDNTIRIWELDVSTFTVVCLAKGNKHTSSVGSVTFGKCSSNICVSVSQDTCLKVWNVPNELNRPESETDLHSLICTSTTLAHDKDVNCVTISPNDRIIATASQDKTAKLWDSSTLSLLGVLRGHRRGVWTVRFSPVDQILLTASADCSMRLWSLSQMNCLKTFEGHESSVLRCEFLTKGMQLLSAGADGLLKIWNIKTNECTSTFGQHDARIWAVALAQNESYFYSGGADSKLIRWKNVTEDKKIAEIEAQQEIILQEQELSNLIVQKKMLKALRLALKLEKPYLTLKIINDVIRNNEIKGLEETIASLHDLHKESLMKHAIAWNTNSRNCRPAQLVINILLDEILSNRFRPSALGRIIEEALPYTDRHFKRMTEYLKDLKFIEFTLKCMQPHAAMEIE